MAGVDAGLPGMGFARGVYYEFIAFPCGGRPYSMPLGVLFGERPSFRVFEGTGLHGILARRGGLIYLLSPLDPLLFVESVGHSLERLLAWEGSCPRVEPSLGSWFSCTAVYERTSGGADFYYCREFRNLSSSLLVYSRTYGCLVELLILKTKAEAGVIGKESLEYARWLYWCVKRSSPGEEKYARVALSILQGIEKALGLG